MYKCHAKLVGVVVLCVVMFPVGQGCGGPDYPTGRVEGSVTLNGQPLEEGTISFVSAQSGRGSGVTAKIVAGRYVAECVPQGTLIINFNATRETGRMIEVFGKSCRERINIIPKRYKLGMEIEIGEENHSHDFQLTGK